MIRNQNLQVATQLGMDADARRALARIEELAEEGEIGVVGRFMPDDGVSAHLASLGVVELVDETEFFRFSRIVIPYCGISPKKQKQWTAANVPLIDLTSPQVRRAQVSLGILKMETSTLFVIGRHSDPESKAICESQPNARVLEDTTDIARLYFAPRSAAVCQTTLAPRRIAWLSEQLRHRWRDADFTFLNTVSQSMKAREQALERQLANADHVIIIGRRGEASSDALADSALRQSRPATIVGAPHELPDLSDCKRVLLTAGGFALDDTVRSVARAIAGKS
ncbi:hypothetical protein [Luteolibacter pohnpeiensis]|nr:hypothetical protein [Luteolibacter pohnpeiensis]